MTFFTISELIVQVLKRISQNSMPPARLMRYIQQKTAPKKFLLIKILPFVQNLPFFRTEYQPLMISAFMACYLDRKRAMKVKLNKIAILLSCCLVYQYKYISI